MANTSNQKAAGAVAGTAKAPRRSAAQWATIVADWHRSGMKARDYAQAHGLVAGTLLWWSSWGLRPLRARASGTPPPAANAPPPLAPGATIRADTGAATARTPAFVPVRVTGRTDVAPRSEPPRLRAEVVLCGGRRVRLRGALTLHEFVQLLDALEGGASC